MTTVEPRAETTVPVRKPLWRRMLGPVLSVGLVVAVFVWFLPQFTSMADVWDSVRSMSWVEIAILVVAEHWDRAFERYAHEAVGAEAGLTADELTALTGAGGRLVSLGDSVLRTSTAGPAAIAVLNVALGRW